MSIGIIYIGLLVVGVVYALITGVFGWLSDLGDADVHVDASGHLEASHPHPISGSTIATFITGFGGGGVVGHYMLGWPLGGSLGVATGSGLMLAAAAFLVLELIFRQTQAGSEFSMEDLVGREAEVVTGIPAGGAGEVVYYVKGQRAHGPARSSDGTAIGRGAAVVVESNMGPTLVVRRR